MLKSRRVHDGWNHLASTCERFLFLASSGLLLGFTLKGALSSRIWSMSYSKTKISIRTMTRQYFSCNAAQPSNTVPLMSVWTSPVTLACSVHQTSPFMAGDGGVYIEKMQWSGGSSICHQCEKNRRNLYLFFQNLQRYALPHYLD